MWRERERNGCGLDKENEKRNTGKQKPTSPPKIALGEKVTRVQRQVETRMEKTGQKETHIKRVLL